MSKPTKLRFPDRVEAGTGKPGETFRFTKGEEVDFLTSEKMSTHPKKPKRLVDLVDEGETSFDTQKLVDLGVAEVVE